MRNALIIMVLLLAGCASTSPISAVNAVNPADPVPETRYPTAIVGYGEPSMRVAGQTWSERGHQLIRIKPGQAPLVQRRVLTHEMLHVAGYRSKAHSNDRSCFFYHSAAPFLPERPCMYELALIRKVTNTYYISAYHDSLSPDLQWAVKFWNYWAGRTIFVMK